jgi:ADP-ribose pyrophosphatase
MVSSATTQSPASARNASGFQAPEGIERIDAYLSVLAQRPDLVDDRTDMPVVTDRDTLVAFARSTGAAIGLVLITPFNLTLVDLVDIDGVLHPYARIIPAEAGGGVSVVACAISGAGRETTMLLVEQFRHATGRYHLELPRGFAHPGTSLAASARAELREETGYDAGQTRLLGEAFTDSGYLQQKMAVFCCTDLTFVGHRREPLERIRSVEAVRLIDLPALVRAGTVADAYVLQAAALLAMERH